MKSHAYSTKYYSLAGKSSATIGDHPGLIELKKLCHQSKQILDFGCGEGSRLNALLKKNQKGTGVDINDYAISQARKKYPRHKFMHYDGKKLPFPDENFDLVYSAFVLEHTQSPELAIEEMIRVLASNGKLVLICPNFGAPNRRSPNSTENPVFKLIRGIFKDFFPPSPDHLHWCSVTPKKTYNQPDDDTTVEPYLGTLKRFLVNKHFKIDNSSSLWSEDLPTRNPRKLLFNNLGQNGIFPFSLYGPQAFISATKLEAI